MSSSNYSQDDLSLWEFWKIIIATLILMRYIGRVGEGLLRAHISSRYISTGSTLKSAVCKLRDWYVVDETRGQIEGHCSCPFFASIDHYKVVYIIWLLKPVNDWIQALERAFYKKVGAGDWAALNMLKILLFRWISTKLVKEIKLAFVALTFSQVQTTFFAQIENFQVLVIT